MGKAEISYTYPTTTKAFTESLSDACAVAVEQSAKLQVPVQIRHGGYVYIVNAAKHDEDNL